MKNRTYTLTLLWFLALPSAFAQNEHLISEPKSYTVKVTGDLYQKLHDKVFSNAYNVFPLLNRIDDTDLQSKVNEYKDLVDHKQGTILLLGHPLDSDGEEDASTLRSIVVTKNSSATPYTDYILGKKKTLLVYIGDPSELQYLNLKLEQQSSLLATQAKDFFKFFGIIQKGEAKISEAAKTDKNITISLIEISDEGIRAPYTLTVSYPQNEDFVLKFHEKVRFSLQVGVAGNQISKNNIKMENGDLIVQPDSAQKHEWKSNLIVMLVFHPFRPDYDRLGPIWKQKPRDLSDIQYFFLQRLGVYGGLKVSKDPIQSIYTGLNFAIAKEFYISAGYTWQNQIIPQVKNTGSITDLDAAKEYANRDYKGSLYWSISMSPSAMLKTLGGK